MYSELQRSDLFTGVSHRARNSHCVFQREEVQEFYKMGTYSNRNHLMPEASTGSSLPHFPWFYHAHFLPGSRAAPHSPQPNQINLEPDLAVEAVQSAAPSSDQVKITTSEKKPEKVRKQKHSSKSADQSASKALKPKQTKKSPRKSKETIFPEAKREKRNLNLDEQRTNFDLSGVPSPYCSCTGIARVCYKWGAGGWQSSCCTIKISEYPLPMSSSRPGSRIAGRKMSNGAYEKLLLKLASEGYDLSHSVDLKDHWARHGTNKFVTIK